MRVVQVFPGVALAGHISRWRWHRSRMDTGVQGPPSPPAQDARHPEVRVDLSQASSAFAVRGSVEMALRLAGVDEAEVAEFTADTRRGGYDQLLQTVATWVAVSSWP